MNLRAKALELVGVACSRCGWSEDSNLLDICTDVVPHRERRALPSAERYKRILAKPTEYFVLCRNCSAVRRAEAFRNRLKTKELPDTIIVWKTSLTAQKVCENRFEFLDKHKDLGYTVLIVPNDNRVQRYGGEQLSVEWAEFAKKHGYERALVEGLQEVKRI